MPFPTCRTGERSNLLIYRLQFQHRHYFEKLGYSVNIIVVNGSLSDILKAIDVGNLAVFALLSAALEIWQFLPYFLQRLTLSIM